MFRLESSEQDALYDLIEGLTGTCQAGSFKKDLLSSNVERRIGNLGLHSFASYVALIADDDYEYEQFLSLITIHTTYWFRENPHFKKLEDTVLARLMDSPGALHLKIWTSACSTGQEAYSIAFVLETIVSLYPRLTYEIFASDIDHVSVATAQKGTYSEQQLNSIPRQYQKWVNLADKHFTIKQSIKAKIHFFQASLLDDLASKFSQELDFIFCRNVLIYFDPKSTLEAVALFERYLSPKGLLVLGHSENFDTSKSQLELDSHSCYRHKSRGSMTSSAADAPILKVFSHPQLIAIGASTGGPEALEVFLRSFPKPCPPIIVVQHINTTFCESFARRLASIAGLECIDTRKKVPLTPDGLYIAWGDYHLTVVEENNLLYVKPTQEPLKNGHRPSVDITFESISKVRARCIGVLLTGMGRDGAEGLLKIKQTRRSLTMAQNKESSVVYGMPKEAIEMGATHIVGTNEYLSKIVRDYVQKKIGIVKAS
jgi:chemotaxis methyl-accepting protein methylase